MDGGGDGELVDRTTVVGGVVVFVVVTSVKLHRLWLPVVDIRR